MEHNGTYEISARDFALIYQNLQIHNAVFTDLDIPAIVRNDRAVWKRIQTVADEIGFTPEN